MLTKYKLLKQIGLEGEVGGIYHRPNGGVLYIGRISIKYSMIKEYVAAGYLEPVCNNIKDWTEHGIDKSIFPSGRVE